MKNLNILILGSTGFVGRNLTRYLSKTYTVLEYNKGDLIKDYSADVVINLIGKAHDLKNVVDPNDYYEVNTTLAIDLFNQFLNSEAKVFIFLSSVKAVADDLDVELTEENKPNPITHYGKSKLLAEEFLMRAKLPKDKRLYILRPCMIHGPGNKGNLNLLHNFVAKGIPWPLGMFDNSRSFCSIENLCFVIRQLIQKIDIPSGVYNVADDEPISTNELIQLMAEVLGKKTRILSIPRSVIKLFSKIGDFLRLPLNTERLQKLTASYEVSNDKIKKAIGLELPIKSRIGLAQTIHSFKNKYD